MTNLLNTSSHTAQTQPATQITQSEGIGIAKSSIPEPKTDEPSKVKGLFPIWQVTLPLGVVSIFMMGSLTTYFISEGRFLFDLSVSWQQIKVRVDADKREIDSTKEKDATRHQPNTETAE